MRDGEPAPEGQQAHESTSPPMVRSSPSSPSVQPHNPDETLANPWQEYVQRILALCGADGASSTDPPGPDLLHPPPGLRSAQNRQPVQPVSIPTEMKNGLVVDPRISAVADPDPPAETNLGTGSGTGSQIAFAHSPLSDDVDRAEQASASKVLILLDMNGTLLYRHKKRKPIQVGEGRRAEPAFVHGKPNPFQYFMRPGASAFVAAMARHPRACVAFFTSMQHSNALPAARILMPEDCRDGEDPEIYDRPFNKHDPQGANHWDTTRDMPKIWSTRHRLGAGFGPHNTIMVDDTPRKMRFMSAGLVVVPEFTETSVVDAWGGAGRRGIEDAEEARRQQEAVMPRLTEYMCRLLDLSVGDVRPFIGRNPFPPMTSLGDNPLHSTSGGAVRRDEALTVDKIGSGEVRSVADAVGVLLTSGPFQHHTWPKTLSMSSSSRGAEHQDELSQHEGNEETLETLLTRPPPPPSRDEHNVESGFFSEGKAVRADDWAAEAVTELLKSACAAADRWDLGRAERQTLKFWWNTWTRLGTAR